MNKDQTYANGQKVSELKGEELTYFFKNGTVRAQGPYVAGKMEGRWVFNRESGQLWQVGHFKHELKTGEWLRCSRDGKLEYHAVFENGKLVKKLVQEPGGVPDVTRLPE